MKYIWYLKKTVNSTYHAFLWYTTMVYFYVWDFLKQNETKNTL